MFLTPGTSFTPRWTACEVIFWSTLTVTRPAPGHRRRRRRRRGGGSSRAGSSTGSRARRRRDVGAAHRDLASSPCRLTKSRPVFGSIRPFRRVWTSASAMDMGGAGPRQGRFGVVAQDPHSSRSAGRAPGAKADRFARIESTPRSPARSSMTAARRTLFVTTALPYANGPFHIGHIMEYIQADVWVRFQRMRGARGALRLRGRRARRADHAEGGGRGDHARRQLIERVAASHREDWARYLISFDHWHSTDSPENVELSQDIYRALPTARRASSTSQHDRAVLRSGEGACSCPTATSRATCPKCGAKDQYGDACENCSTTYAPTDLVGIPPPRSPARTPELRVVRAPVLPALGARGRRVPAPLDRDTRRGAVPAAGGLQQGAASGSGEGKLGDWDISRDAPYFGIPIPDAPGKYFYVWLDAPIGYLAALRKHFDRAPRGAPIRRDAQLRRVRADPAVEQYHFIGKDIVYFHTLFWPAMLEFVGKPYKTPTNVFVHGFITASGEKMSKSRGTGDQPGHLPRPRHEPRVAALLPRGEAERPGRGHRLQPRRLRRAREQRPRRQVREHREPGGDVPVEALRRSRREGRRAARAMVVDAGRRRGGRHRRGAGRPRVREGDAPDHGARRPHQPLLRREAAVARSRRIRRSATSSTASAATASSASGTSRCSSRRSCPRRRARPRTSSGSTAPLGWADLDADLDPHRSLRAPDDPHRPQADRRAARTAEPAPAQAEARPPSRPQRPRPRPAGRSRSTTSRRSTCVSRASSPPSTSTGPTSC